MMFSKSNSESIDECIKVLKAGKVVIIPTDTVYGFSGIVDEVNHTDDAIRKIKGREEAKPFIQLIGNPEDISKYTDDIIPSKILRLWPCPLTIIVHNKDSEKTTAFRCPDEAWLHNLLVKLGSPIYSTSVNRSGKPILETVSEIEKEFSDEVSLIIDDGDKKGGVASTIISIENGEVKVLRQGAVVID